MDSLKGIRKNCFQHKDTLSKHLPSQSSSTNAQPSMQVSPPSVSTQAASSSLSMLLMK